MTVRGKHLHIMVSCGNKKRRLSMVLLIRSSLRKQLKWEFNYLQTGYATPCQCFLLSQRRFIAVELVFLHFLFCHKTVVQGFLDAINFEIGPNKDNLLSPIPVWFCKLTLDHLLIFG